MEEVYDLDQEKVGVKMGKGNGEGKIEDADAPWLDHEGKTIFIPDCINALYLAASLFTKELEFNSRIKESEPMKYEYKRSMIIMQKLRENYERALRSIQEAQVKQRMIPGRQSLKFLKRKK